MNLDLLQRALDVQGQLPSATDLQDLLVAAELALFTDEQDFDDRLRDAGWYLHSVATAPSDDDVISPRRGEAARVSGHIFDVFLQQVGHVLPEAVYRRHEVAAQAGYLIGGVAPNAVAVGARSAFEAPSFLSDPGLASLHAARLLLGLDLRSLQQFLAAVAQEVARIPDLQIGSVAEGPYSAAHHAIEGVAHLQRHLVTGTPEDLDAARAELGAAMRAPFAQFDTDSRWVAALLSDFGTAYASTSIRSLLPDAPNNVHLAFTLGDPPVVLLWPPQAEMLRQQPSPFDSGVRRIVLSFPTSAGKTLLAQLLICQHLATQQKDVCFVAPTHSLCREVKAALDARLLYLGTSAHDAGGATGPDITPGDARVLVLTPERLSSMLRADPEAVLDRYSMFVVDEAHLLAERQRGWGLEEAITLLHHLTRERDHRLVVMSAALGNSAHIAQWLSTHDEPVTSQSDWRGPRRLQVIYAPEPVWAEEVETPAVGARQARRTIPLSGKFHLRPRGYGLMTGSFGPVGQLVLRYSPAKVRFVKDAVSTVQVEQLLPMVRHLATGAGSPCLVVVASRRDARNFAQMIASELDEVDGNDALAELVGSRLPAQHPLPVMVRKGVAYHHGVLPREIQAEVEDATRRKQIRCLVATTTLTEGVNLPFRSIVIGTTGWGSGDDKQEVIDPARLLNAFGRAGRAGRETEGWLFYAHFGEQFTIDAFAVFDRSAADLAVESTLASDDALLSLIAFEAMVAEGTDAVLADAGPAANGFAAYVWFIADVLAQIASPLPLGERVDDVLRSTLAWRQFDEDRRQRWSGVASRSLASYETASPSLRQRWSRAGTSLHSASVLEGLVPIIRDRIVNHGPCSSPEDWLRLVVDADTIRTLVTLPENWQFRGIRPRPNASLENAIDLDLVDLLARWVHGDELDAMSSALLTQIADDDFRADALTEFVAAVFEHHLPWVLRILTTWINAGLSDDARIPAALPSYVQFGVASESALELMTSGVRSRRLATAVAATLGPAEPDQLRGRLRNMNVDEWRTYFDAAPTEIKDLLAYVHDPTLQPVARLLAGEPVFMPYVPSTHDLAAGTAATLELEGSGVEPRGWEVVAEDGTLAGVMPPPAYIYVETLVGLGRALEIVLDPENSRLIVTGSAAGPLASG